MEAIFTPELQKFITEIAVQLLIVALPVVVTQTFLVLRQLAKSIRARLSTEQVFLLESLAAIGVRAAEQSGLNGSLQNIGQEKREYAVAFVKKALESRGLKDINVDEIEAAIEAAIRLGLQNANEDTPTEGVVLG